MNNAELVEICDTLEALRRELDDLVVRGLRTAGPQDLAALQTMQEELVRIGANHLAGRIDELLRKVRGDDRTAAGALLRVQTTLRVFERVLSLDTVAGLLAADSAIAHDDAEPFDGDEDGEE